MPGREACRYVCACVSVHVYVCETVHVYVCVGVCEYVRVIRMHGADQV